jgi:hypothetical protein
LPFGFEQARGELSGVRNISERGRPELVERPLLGSSILFEGLSRPQKRPFRSVAFVGERVAR